MLPADFLLIWRGDEDEEGYRGRDICEVAVLSSGRDHSLVKGYRRRCCYLYHVLGICAFNAEQVGHDEVVFASFRLFSPGLRGSRRLPVSDVCLWRFAGLD